MTIDELKFNLNYNNIFFKTEKQGEYRDWISVYRLDPNTKEMVKINEEIKKLFPDDWETGKYDKRKGFAFDGINYNKRDQMYSWLCRKTKLGIKSIPNGIDLG